MTKKKVIDKYDPQIYPIKLYVAKNADVKDLQKIIPNVDKECLPSNGYATTTSGLTDKDGKCCFLVVINTKKIGKKITDEDIDTCAHEALHVVIDTFARIGQSLCLNSSEACCYFVGWCTKCIYKTLIK